MQSRPFSIVLPGGKRLTSYATLLAALRDARTCNASRVARDLPCVMVLDRSTGRVYDVAPGADILAIEAAP